NVLTDLGITNGSQGFMQRIFTASCSAGFMYATCVVVEFPHSKVDLTDLPRTWYPIIPVMWTFTTLLDKADSSKEKIHVTHSQLPIQLAFMITGHSAQGKTLLKVLVDLSDSG
ncbi:hypothetical protein EDD16DRAFT_1437421, partial [Pisolithus croceorrhizus]